MPLDPGLERLLDRAVSPGASVVFLTGAGISAESGIPTFRGTEGYWRVGSRNYHPQEMATWEAFQRMPDEVWTWYLYRRSVCLAAKPNIAHDALATLERALGDAFLLVTQNVDGLHLRAGNTLARTWQIHGNVDFMRCSAECPAGATPIPIPAAIPRDFSKERRLADSDRALLQCPHCHEPARPHVLWFDETYDEPRYKFDSSIRAATGADLLVVIGTSGATNLPLQIGAIVARRGAPMIAINPDESPFTDMATAMPSGFFARATAGEIVPDLAAAIATRGS
jgi:NAD-dependent deacetylase